MYVNDVTIIVSGKHNKTRTNNQAIDKLGYDVMWYQKNVATVHEQINVLAHSDLSVNTIHLICLIWHQVTFMCLLRSNLHENV